MGCRCQEIAHQLFPRSFPQLNTAHQFGVVVRILASLTSILNDALHIVTGCLLPAPTEDLPVLTSIQPAELRRLGATLSLANCAIHDPDHVLHRLLVGQQDEHQERLRSRRPFVPAAWKLLGSLSELDIRVK